jgi:hypothetical protein
MNAWGNSWKSGSWGVSWGSYAALVGRFVVRLISKVAKFVTLKSGL